MRSHPRSFPGTSSQSRRGHRRPALHDVLGLLVVTALLGACGSGAGSDGPGTVTFAPVDEPVTTTTAVPPAATWLTDDASGTITVADTGIGTILVDGQGAVLYLHRLDEGGVPSCTGRCLEQWEPVAAPVAGGEGLDATLLGAVTNTDGLTQVTFNGHPLYRYANEAAANEPGGHGINDIWFAVTPQGTAAGS